MIDPRELLRKELAKLGLDKNIVSIIALDAGSSQCIVNKKYLRELNIEISIFEKVYKKIVMFYMGELYE